VRLHELGRRRPYMRPTATSRTLSRSAKLLKLSNAFIVRVLAPCSRARSCCDESASKRGILGWRRGEAVKMDGRVGACLFDVLAGRGHVMRLVERELAE
jgi:hypothetical protein